MKDTGNKKTGPVSDRRWMLLRGGTWRGRQIKQAVGCSGLCEVGKKGEWHARRRQELLSKQRRVSDDELVEEKKQRKGKKKSK